MPGTPPPPFPHADVVSEGRLLLIVANKLDALAPAERQQALGLIRQTVEDCLPDVRWVLFAAVWVGGEQEWVTLGSAVCRTCLDVLRGAWGMVAYPLSGVWGYVYSGFKGLIYLE